jgi:hypothetical protein
MKNFEKEEAIVREQENEGRIEGGLRERSESRPDHKFLGLNWFWETKFLKNNFLEWVINFATFLA